MKILVLAQSAGIGGVESSLVNFVRYLNERQHEVSVVFWRDSGPVMDALPSGVRIIDVQKGLAEGIYRTPGLREALRTGSLLAKAQALGFILIRKLLSLHRNPWVLLNRIPEQFDVAIAYRHQGYGPYYLIDGVRAKKKLMWFHHGEYIPSPMGESVDRAYYEKVDRVVAVAEPTRSMLLSHFPSLEGRISVIQNIIDEEAIRWKADHPADQVIPAAPDLTILTVSRLSAEKGVDLAVQTAKLLAVRGARFTWYVIGDGPEREALQALVNRLGIGDNFVLLGERTNPFPNMMQADLYVQTSRVEAHPLTIQEAMVLRKPIIAAAIPSIAAVLEHGRLGILCELTPEAFADAIEAVATTPRLSAALVDRLRGHHPPNATAYAQIDKLLAE